MGFDPKTGKLVPWSYWHPVKQAAQRREQVRRQLPPRRPSPYRPSYHRVRKLKKGKPSKRKKYRQWFPEVKRVELFPEKKGRWEEKYKTFPLLKKGESITARLEELKKQGYSRAERSEILKQLKKSKLLKRVGEREISWQEVDRPVKLKTVVGRVKRVAGGVTEFAITTPQAVGQMTVGGECLLRERRAWRELPSGAVMMAGEMKVGVEEDPYRALGGLIASVAIPTAGVKVIRLSPHVVKRIKQSEIWKSERASLELLPTKRKPSTPKAKKHARREAEKWKRLEKEEVKRVKKLKEPVVERIDVLKEAKKKTSKRFAEREAKIDIEVAKGGQVTREGLIVKTKQKQKVLEEKVKTEKIESKESLRKGKLRRKQALKTEVEAKERRVQLFAEQEAMALEREKVRALQKQKQARKVRQKTRQKMKQELKQKQKQEQKLKQEQEQRQRQEEMVLVLPMSCTGEVTITEEKLAALTKAREKAIEKSKEKEKLVIPLAFAEIHVSTPKLTTKPSARKTKVPVKSKRSAGVKRVKPKELKKKPLVPFEFRDKVKGKKKRKGTYKRRAEVIVNPVLVPKFNDNGNKKCVEVIKV